MIAIIGKKIAPNTGNGDGVIPFDLADQITQAQTNVSAINTIVNILKSFILSFLSYTKFTGLKSTYNSTKFCNTNGVVFYFFRQMNTP